ncbi:MAG TPA: chromate efflux transporter [Tahibacter sp.]|uniref:chromate efflux transporter n=1 Tax=Tahibacter sp. TaxID=2056211 RepID=UPI002BC2F0AE|nr:chromate efflux transporter [Tahibacter sp.]HSX59842.1 chromate efflux transporter [Tahibacter sp.]
MSGAPQPVGLAEATRFWARIGWLSFGGPAGQIALMHREIVEQRRWISESRFLHALNYCMLLPGPEAQQLAVYIGWLMHRTAGGLIAGLLFVLPGCLVMLALSLLYATLGQVPLVAALLFGLKAAVLAIVVEAVLRVARRALRHSLTIGIAVAAFVAIFAFGVPFPLIVLGAALLGALGRHLVPRAFPAPAADGDGSDGACLVDSLLARGQLAHTRPSLRRAATVTVVAVALWFAPLILIAAWLGSDAVITQQGVLFSQTAMVTFGGAYAVLAYVAQRVVEDFRWLTPGQMLDGLGLAETTPGPLILVVQFVAFQAAYQHQAGLAPWVAGVVGSLLATWVTFAPCFLWIFLGAPYVEALRHNRTLHAALSAITAAVVGVIANLGVWFALHTLFREVRPWSSGWLRLDVPIAATFDPAAAALAAFAAMTTFSLKWSMGRTLLSTALLGAAWTLLRG